MAPDFVPIRAATGALDLGSEGEEAYRLLLTSMELADGFELDFVVSPSVWALKEVADRLQGERSSDLVVQMLAQTPEALRNVSVDLLTRPVPTGGRPVWVLLPHGLRVEVHAAWTRAAVLLNEQRNRIIQSCPGTLVLCCVPEMLTVVHDMAPDFWSVRSHVFAIPDPPDRATAGGVRPTTPEPWLVGDLMADQLQPGLHYVDLANGLAASSRPQAQRDRTALLIRAADAYILRGALDEALAAVHQAIALTEKTNVPLARAQAYARVATVAMIRGDLDEALLTLRDECIPQLERLGDARSLAVAKGQVADILQARGDLDESLRIRREEELPVYERLGDVRSVAVAKSKVADILYRRGNLDEALHALREECIPWFRQLGDARSLALAEGQVADILQVRGELDESLRIRQEEELPVYERLGDVREMAVAKGKIADILKVRGDLDQALRINRDIILPVFRQLDDVLQTAITWGAIADILQARGDLDEALRIRREEELPTYERLGDVRSTLVARANVAVLLARRAKPDDRPEAERLLSTAHAEAVRLRLPEAQLLKQWLARWPGTSGPDEIGAL